MARRLRRSRASNQRWGQMIETLRLMNYSFTMVRLYPPTHTETVGALTRLHESLKPILEEQEDVGFGFMEQMIYIEGAMSIEETVANQMLVDRFTRCRVEYLTYGKGVSMEELSLFFQVLNAQATKPSEAPLAQQLEEKGVKTINVIEAEIEDTASKSKASRKKTLFDWYERAVTAVQAASAGLRDGTEADFKPLHRVVDDMMATIRNKGYEPFILLPALGQGLDPHAAHSVNVAILCCAMGDIHGLNTGQINTLCVAALLHDLGRVTIPADWAADGSPLTEEERRIADMHADWGFLLLARNGELPLQTALLAGRHHGGPSRGGYAPDTFHKIMALADAYDLARISGKYYWRRHRQDRMLRRMLSRRGLDHDPSLIKLLVNCVGYYPVGSLVRLDDGRRGIVVRPNAANSSRPKLYMFDEAWTPPPAAAGEAAHPAADPAEEPPPVILELAELEPSGLGFKRSIAGTLTPGPGADVHALLDKKKEYLLSYTI